MSELINQLREARKIRENSWIRWASWTRWVGTRGWVSSWYTAPLPYWTSKTKEEEEEEGFLTSVINYIWKKSSAIQSSWANFWERWWDAWREAIDIFNKSTSLWWEAYKFPVETFKDFSWWPLLGVTNLLLDSKEEKERKREQATKFTTGLAWWTFAIWEWLAAPITAALQPWIESASEEDYYWEKGIVWEWLDILDTVQQWGWEKYQDIYKKNVGGRELTEKENDVTKYVGGEAAINWLTWWWIYWVSKLPSVMAKTSSKISSKINWSSDKVNKKVNDFILQNEKDLGMLKGDENSAKQFRSELEEFFTNVNTNRATVDDVDYLKNRWNLKDTKFFSSLLEESNQVTTVNKSMQDSLFAWYYKNATAKQIKQIDAINKKLEELKFDFDKKFKTQRDKVDKIKTEFKIGDNQISEAISIRNRFYDDDIETQFNRINQINTQKKKWDWKEIKDTYQFSPKTNSAIKLEESGFVKIEDVPGREYSVQLTKKWEKFIDSQKNIAPYVKDLIKKDWLAHIPKNIYDYNKGNIARKAEEIKKTLDWTEEMKRIWEINERIQKWKAKTTDYNDINIAIEELNERFNLWLKGQIDNTFNYWYVNSSRLNSIIDEIVEFRKNSFLTLKNVKFPTPKNIKQKLLGQQKITNAVYKEATKQSKIEFQKEKNKINQKYEQRFRNLNKNKDKLGDTYKVRIDELSRIRREELIHLNAKHNNIKTVKQLIKTQLTSLYKNKAYKWDVGKTAFSKIINSKQFDNASTPTQIEKAVASIYKDLSIKYAQNLKKEIGNELNIWRITKSSDRRKKESYTVRDRIRIETFKEIFNVKKWKLSLEEMEKFLQYIKAEKEMMKTKNSKAVLDRNMKNAENVEKAKEEGIAQINWRRNVQEDAYTNIFRNTKERIKTLRNITLFMPRIIEKIFGRDGVVYDKLVRETDYKYSNFESFYQNKIEPAVVLLHKLFGEDIRDFWAFKFITQRQIVNGEVIYPGVNKFRLDEVEKGVKGWYLSQRTTKTKYNTPEDLPADFPLPFREWEKIKDLKIGETIERWRENSFVKWWKVWDWVFSTLWTLTQKTAENLWVNIGLREWYVPFKLKDKSFDDTDLWLGEEMHLANKLQDGFLENVTNSVGGHYEYNPLNLLVTSGKQQAYFAFMAEHFDDLKGLVNWRTFSVKDLWEDVMMGHIEKGEHSFYNSKGKRVKPEPRSDWLYDKESWEVLDVDQLTIKFKWWIKDELNPEGQVLMDSILETVSQWWPWIRRGMLSSEEQMVAKIVNHANLLPLVGSISVILKQWLVNIDALWVDGVRQNILSSFRDLAKNPEAAKNLHQIPDVAARGGWIYLTKELASITPKGLKGWTMAYKEYIKLWTLWMRVVDEFFYSRVYYSAYKNYMVKNGLAKKSDIIEVFDNKEAVKYANDLAKRTAWTANPLWMPEVYKSPLFKSFFGIFTTQLNRVQEYSWAMRAAYRDADYWEMLLRTNMFLIQNATEVAVTYWVGKFMYTIWASKYEEYNKDFFDLFFSTNTLYQTTLWQTFVWSKVSSLAAGFSPSPVLGFWDRLSSEILWMYNAAIDWEWDVVMEKFIDSLTTAFWGSFARYVVNILEQ